MRKGDVKIAKNYLQNAEISDLNLIVTMFLDAAELRARRRQTLRLAEWEGILDSFLTSNELPKLNHTGSVSHEKAANLAEQHYDHFDSARKLAAQKSELAISELEELEKIAKSTKKEQLK